MDFGFCGIIDIIIVLGALIMFFVGFKKGFITKILSIASILLIIVFAFIFATTLTGYMKEWGIAYPTIYQHILENIETNLAEKGAADCTETYQIVARLMNTSDFIAKIIVRVMGSGIPQEAEALKVALAETLTRWSCNVISFFVIVIGVILVIAIAKLIAAILRENKVFKFVDGVFGVLLYEVIYAVFLSVIFTVIYLFIKYNWVDGATNFFNIDMQLTNNNFRISKWFYENNYLLALIRLFVAGF